MNSDMAQEGSPCRGARVILVAVLASVARRAEATTLLRPPSAAKTATAQTASPVRLTLVPLGDQRSYLFSELPNGLQVLNVMDSRSNYKAAAVAVQAGSLDDPESLPGLAHFCEHMLFLGTKKYPTPSGFDDFTTAHGGMSNAYTSNDVTVYFAQYVEPNSSGGLDRFADFFREPTFNRTFVQKEVHAIDSEHAKNVQDPTRRVLSTLYSIADPESPLSRFHTGNVETLYSDPLERGENPVDALEVYFKENYCPRRMRLVTYGAQPLEEQLREAQEHFSDLAPFTEKCASKRAIFWAKPNPWPKQRMQKFLEVQGSLPQTELWAHFSLPDLSAHYQSQPLSYIDYILSYDGENSLSTLLKDEMGLVSRASSMYDMSTAGTNLFIMFTLTHKGRDQLGLVLSVFYAYLAKLRRSGVDEALYESLVNVTKLKWDWAELAGPMDTVSDLAERMTRLPASELLSGDGLIVHPDPNLVQTLFEMLTPDNMNLVHVVPPSAGPMNGSFVQFDDKEARTLPFYNVRYMVQNTSDILPGFSEKWSAWLEERVDSRVANNPEFVLPQPPSAIQDVPANIATDHMHVDSHDAVDGDIVWGPWPVSSQKNGRPISNALTPEVWYRSGWESFSPKASFQIVLLPVRRPDEPEISAVDKVRLAVYGQLLSAEIFPRLVDLTNTGVDFQIGVGSDGLSFSFAGFEPLMPRLVDKVLEEFSRFNNNRSITKPSRFSRIVEEFRESLETYAEMPVNYAVSGRNLMMTSGSHARIDMIDALAHIDIPSVASSVDQLLLSRPLQFTSLAMGNIAGEKVSSVIHTFASHFNDIVASPIPGGVVERMPRIVNPQSPVEARVQNPRDGDPNDAVVVSLIAGVVTVPKRVRMELIGKVFSNVINKELRTQRQLGYVVSGGVGILANVLYLSAVVQGTVLNADDLEAAVESVYLKVMPQSLDALTQEDFLSYKASTLESLLQPPTSIADESSHFWGAVIQSGRCFDLNSNMLRYLNETLLTKDALVKEYAELVMPREGTRKKVVVKYFANEVPPRLDASAAEAAYTKQGVPSEALALLSREYGNTMVFNRTDANTRMQLMGVDRGGYFSADVYCDLGTNMSAPAPAPGALLAISTPASAGRVFMQHFTPRGRGSRFHDDAVLSPR